MAGNNSCGSRSIAYGNMVHNVLGIDAWLADGSAASLRPASTTLRRAARAIADVRARRSPQRIAPRSRRAGRRCCAASAATTSTSSTPQSERPYTDDGSVNLAHLLVGSEGTLALHASADAASSRRCRAPRCWASSTSRPSTRRWTAAQHIVKLGPTAVELVDRTMIELALREPGVRADDRDAR